MEPLINGCEGAKLLRISYPTLMRWVSEGHGPPYYLLNELSQGNLKRKKRKDGQERQIRRVIRFRATELEAWLETKREGVQHDSR